MLYYRSKFTLGLILFSLFIFAINNSATAQDNQNNQIGQTSVRDNMMLEKVGSWPYGPYSEVAIDEDRNYAYINSGGVVLIIDISDVNSPQLVNDKIRASGAIEDIYYDAGTQNLYLALLSNGIDIWNVQDINAPELLGHLVLDYAGATPPAYRLAAKPGYLFVAAGFGGIITINISDPENPYESSIALGDGHPQGTLKLDETGNYMVAAGDETQLYSVGSDGTLDLLVIGPPLVSAADIEIYNGYSFQVSQGYLWVLDLSNQLAVVSYYQLPGNQTTNYNIDRNGNTIYVSDPFYGVETFDISNPANPLWLGSYQMNSNDLSYFDGHVYAPKSDGMNIIDVSDPQNLSLTSEYTNVGGLSYDVKVSGNYAFMISALQMYVIDISDPGDPVMVASNKPQAGSDVFIIIKGNYAYISNTMEGIRVVDISDPELPETVYESGSSRIGNIVMEGNYIYGIQELHQLSVIDISDPEMPVEVGSATLTPQSDYPYGLDVSNGYVYVTQDRSGLKVFDVSDPSNPTLVNTFDQYVYFNYVTIKDDYAYVIDSYYGVTRIYVFDLSDPAAPDSVNVFSFEGLNTEADFIYHNGDFLYAADHIHSDLTLLDISHPDNPTFSFTQMMPDQIFGAGFTDDYVFFATWAAGLQIYQNPVITGIDNPDETGDERLTTQLLCYPNPFRDNTNVSFNIQKRSRVKLQIYSQMGKLVSVLSDGVYEAGEHSLYFDAKNLTPGIYYCRLIIDRQVITKKILIQ